MDTPDIVRKEAKINKEITEEINRSIASALKSNEDIEKAIAVDIQKRGFTYTGDDNNAFGLGGIGLHGKTGHLGFGRGLFTGGYTLQPFGLGALDILQGGTGTSLGQSSLLGGSGSGSAVGASTNIARYKMALCVDAYKGFGVVKNVIDLMCNFASEGLVIMHPSKRVKRFYEKWARMVDLQGRVKAILRYYYKYGNVFIYTTMGEVTNLALKSMQSTRGDSNDPNQKGRKKDVEKEAKKPLNQKMIPWRYNLLNPFQMDIRGGKFFGEAKWYFILDEFTFKKIQGGELQSKHIDMLDETDINLPPELKTLPKDDRAILLDQNKLWTLQYMKDDHEDWADPMIWPVMNDIVYKNALRAMDRSVIDSTINAVTVYKLGRIEEGYVAPPEHYAQLGQILRTPTYSHNIVWNDTLKLESNYPPISDILGVEKYRSVDKDILAGIGIPSILVDGGEGGSFSNAFLQVRTLLERLEEGRREVLKWVNKQLRIISETMDHKQVPIVRFGQMSLRDEEAEKRLVIQLLDRNIISAQRVHEVFGMDTVIELERLKEEKKIAEEQEILIKHSPFSEPISELADDLLDEPTKPGNNKLPVGRPSPSKKIPQEKKRKTKPKGQGLGELVGEYEKYRSLGRQKYSAVEDRVTNLMIKLKNVSYKKSLSKEDKENLEYLIYAVFSNISPYGDINKEIEENLISAKINMDINNIVVTKIKELKNASAQDRREIRISAFAQNCLREDM